MWENGDTAEMEAERIVDYCLGLERDDDLLHHSFG